MTSIPGPGEGSYRNMRELTTIRERVGRDRMPSRSGIMAWGRVMAGATFFAFFAGMAYPAGAGAQGVDPEALNALYSLDFDRAEESFRRWTVRDPDNPTAWNLLASAIWLEIVYEQEKMSLDGFTGSRLGTAESTERVSEEREAHLRRTLDRAIAAAQAILKNDPQNLEALYALGVSYGSLASFEAMAKKSYRAAHSAARKARDYHMQVLRRDPSFNDARLTVGTYDYAVGVIPWPIRFPLGLFGIRGDKEDGIEQLEYAARLGVRAETNARVVLVVVYNRENRYEDALDVLEDLHRSYPRNYLFEMAIGSVHEKMKAWPAAVETYRSVLGKMEADVDGYGRFEPEPVLFKMAEAQVHGERFDQSIPLFEAVIADPDSSDGLKAQSHLWLGRIFEDREPPGRAAAHFRAVLALDCSEDLKKEARRHL